MKLHTCYGWGQLIPSQVEQRAGAWARTAVSIDWASLGSLERTGSEQRTVPPLGG